MISPELSIILLNASIVVVAYFSIYPKLAGNNFNKIARYDFIVSCIALLMVGFKFAGTDVEFNLLGVKVNWFIFTLITYSAIEIPTLIWYCKKHKVDIKH